MFNTARSEGENVHPELLIIAKKKKKGNNYSPTAEWANKMWYIHAMKYYSTIKRNEVLIHATTWINLENIN